MFGPRLAARLRSEKMARIWSRTAMVPLGEWRAVLSSACLNTGCEACAHAIVAVFYISFFFLFLLFRLHQVNSLFLVQRTLGFGKNSENKTKKIDVYFSEPKARWLLREWARSLYTSPQLHATIKVQPFVGLVMQPLEGSKFVFWCSFSPQLKMTLVSVEIALDREIALDWFVLQTPLQDQTF